MQKETKNSHLNGWSARAIRLHGYPKDVFIDATDVETYYKKRGKRVIESVMGQPGSFGLVGSDVVDEWFYDQANLDVTTIEPIKNTGGNRLRFALLGPDRAYDTDTYVTKYPNTARRLLGLSEDVKIIVADGAIEAEIDDLGVPGFELVQTGESVRTNGIRVIEDNLAIVSLCVVARSRWA